MGLRGDLGFSGSSLEAAQFSHRACPEAPFEARQLAEINRVEYVPSSGGNPVQIDPRIDGESTIACPSGYLSVSFRR